MTHIDHLSDIPNALKQKIDGQGHDIAGTELSKFRTELSEYRSEMSKHRTALSEQRTDLSIMRSHLANERTHLAEVRTAVSLMSFGVTLNRFSIYLEESDRMVRTSAFSTLHDVQNVGLGMALLGIVVLALSLWRFLSTKKEITANDFTPPRNSIFIVSCCLLAIGAGTAVWMIRG